MFLRHVVYKIRLQHFPKNIVYIKYIPAAFYPHELWNISQASGIPYTHHLQESQTKYITMYIIDIETDDSNTRLHEEVYMQSLTNLLNNKEEIESFTNFLYFKLIPI